MMWKYQAPDEEFHETIAVIEGSDVLEFCLDREDKYLRIFHAKKKSFEFIGGGNNMREATIEDFKGFIRNMFDYYQSSEATI